MDSEVTCRNENDFEEFISDYSGGSWVSDWYDFLASKKQEEKNSMLYTEINHIQHLPYDGLIFLNDLIMVWYSLQNQGKDEMRIANLRTVREISLKKRLFVSELCGFDAIRHDVVNALPIEKEKRVFRLIDSLNAYVDDDDRPIIYYTVDWDVARLGFPEYHGEREEAWKNLEYRYKHGLFRIEDGAKAQGLRKKEAQKEKYQAWIMTKDGESVRKQLADEAVRMGYEWETMTEEQRKEFILEKGFDVYMLDFNRDSLPF